MFTLIKYIPTQPKIDFLSRRNVFAVFSVILFVGSIGLFFVQGLNFGVDFRGGILIEARTDGPADLAELRSTLGGLDLGEVTLQEFGQPTDVLINVQRQEGDEAEQIKAIQIVKEALGSQVVEYRRTEFVGPKVGSELKQAALLATILTLTGLSQHSEIVVMKAAGLSAHRVLFPLGAASAMIAGAHLLFSETVVADATAELDYWADQDYAADVAPPPDVTSKVWLVDNGTLVLVDAVSRVGNRLVLDKVSLFERNGEGLLYNLVKADFAWHQDGRWTLFDVRRFDLEQHTLSVDSSLPWDLGISPDRFQVLTVNPRHVGIVSLWRSIQRLAGEGQAVGPLTASLYQKIAGPAATLLMPLLGALAGFGFQRARSLLLRAVLGMALGFAFFVVDNFMLAMGEFGVLPPVLAAFAPLVLFGCVGFAVLFYTED